LAGVADDDANGGSCHLDEAKWWIAAGVADDEANGGPWPALSTTRRNGVIVTGVVNNEANGGSFPAWSTTRPNGILAGMVDDEAKRRIFASLPDDDANTGLGRCCRQ
jgi:hypothetical protein